YPNLKPISTKDTISTAAKCKSLNTNPLIPPSIIDIASQRVYFISIFLLIQAWKFTNSLNLSKSQFSIFNSLNFYFILKFFIIDSIYLWILPIFRVPYLTFNPFITFLQIILVTCFTILLLSLSSSLSSASSPILNNHIQNQNHLHINELNLIDNKINTKNLDPNAHFIGKKIINILPKSNSIFNPFNDTYCLNVNTDYNQDYNLNKINDLSINNLPFNYYNQIEIPLKINSTYDISFLQLIYYDYNSDQKLPIYLNYTKKALKKLFLDQKLNDYYLKKDISSNPQNQDDIKNKVFFLKIPIVSPGYYKINKVLDSKGSSLSISNPNIIIPQCPLIQINNQADYQLFQYNSSIDKNNISKQPVNTNLKCVNDLNDIEVTVHGVPPLSIKYKKMINQKVDTIYKTNLIPQNHNITNNNNNNLYQFSNFKSPLLFSPVSISNNDLENFKSWSNSAQFKFNLENSILYQTGDYSYKIEEIVDGFGNIINYDLIYDSFYKHLINNQHEKPSPLFENSKKNISLIVHNSFNRASNLHTLNSNGPFKANISFVDDETFTESSFIYEFNSYNNYNLEIEKPGTYSLISIDSKYCPSVIPLDALPVVEYRALKPNLKIYSNEPVINKCLGQIGIKFDLLFTGSPPFKVKLSIYRTDLKKNQKTLFDIRRLISNIDRHQYDFQPASEGNYEIQFEEISDSIYKDFLPLENKKELVFKTTMRAKPDAKFINSNKDLKKIEQYQDICLFENYTARVKLQGEPPFELAYESIEVSTNRRLSKTISNINSNLYDLEIPGFKLGGTYSISLLSIVDSSGCLVLLKNQEIRFNVKKFLPYAEFLEFDSRNKPQIKKGDRIELPINLIGDKNLELSYSYRDHSGEIVEEDLIRNYFKANNVYEDKISVYKEGIYHLKGLKDSLCKGTVNENIYYNISYFDMPTIKLLEKPDIFETDSGDKFTFTKQDICVNNDSNFVDLEFNGHGPFVVHYEVELPHGSTKKNAITSGSNFLSINLINGDDLKGYEKKGGNYKVTFTGVYDSIYSEGNSRLDNFKEITIFQQILPLPWGEFNFKNNGNKQFYKACQNLISNSGDGFSNLINSKNLENNSLKPIILELTGSKPFTIYLEVFNESLNKVYPLILNNINSNRLNLNSKIYSYLSLGKHYITIKKIVDGKGCIQEDFSKIRGTKNQLIVSITDIPRIKRLTPLEINKKYCVGDHVKYELIGQPPFEVSYRFNSKKHTTEVEDYHFFRLASEVGLFEILSIKDAMNCEISFSEEEIKENKYGAYINPIPSVQLSTSVEHIHEGDEVELTFRFIDGTPPFNLVYRRYFNNGNNHEDYYVSDIREYEYKTVAYLEGSYEAIKLEDAYC
ncbi:Pom152p ASCRUDRAFT_17529, partial [Ascoidea rubescens DSM 1968]